MTTPHPFVDHAQPSHTTITLPVLTESTQTAALLLAMEQTMEHLGLLHYQHFLNTLQAHWPPEVESLRAEHDGQGYVLLSMNERDCVKDGNYDPEALTVFRRTMSEMDQERPNTFFRLLDKGFQHGKLTVERHEVPGLLLAGLNDSLRARVQGAMLALGWPETTDCAPAKLKF